MLSKGLGGIETAFAHYTQALHAHGAEVVCATSPGALTPKDLGIHANVTLKNLSQIDLFALYRAARLIQMHQPDAILVHGRRAFRIMASAQRFVGKHTPLIQVMHRPRFKNLERADHVVTVSQQLRDQVIQKGFPAEAVTYIPNFLTTPPAILTTRDWHTPAVIGFLGRLVPVKGPDIFLDALALLQLRGVAFRARLGGSGALEESLQQQAQALGLMDKIDWCGWVENAQDFYSQLDLFCLPSRAESFGLVVLEAFAAGTPIVATRTSGPSELIIHERTGLLCDITAESLADALCQALQQPQIMQNYAANAWAEADKYTLNAVAPQIMACITQAVKNGSLLCASNGRSVATNQ